MATINIRQTLISIFVCLFTVQSNPAIARAPVSQESLNATAVLLVNEIKHKCNVENPTNDEAFNKCAQSRYDAMYSYHEKLFMYRDTKGIESSEFKSGIECVVKYSPEVNEPNRKYAIEHANWIKVNDCYEKALK